MKTEDIPNKPPSMWHHEPDPQILAVLGKLGEEANELGTSLCRAIIQGLREKDPDDGRTNIEHIEDEIADVLAMVMLFIDYAEPNIGRINDRSAKKYEYKRSWIESLGSTP